MGLVNQNDFSLSQGNTGHDMFVWASYHMGINEIIVYIDFNYIWALNRGTCVRDFEVQGNPAWTQSMERQKFPQEGEIPLTHHSMYFPLCH